MLGAAIVKEIQLLLRDRGTLLSMFLLPLVFIAFFGSMYGSSSGNGKDEARLIPVWHEPGDARAAAVVKHIEDSQQFRPRLENSADDVRALVAGKDADVGLVFPAQFDVAAGRPAELVIDEGASLQFRAPLQGQLHGLMSTALADAECQAHLTSPPFVSRTPPGIDAPLRDAGSFQISVTGNVVLFVFFISVTIALSFVEERRTGTWRRLLATPVHRSVLLFAKLVPFYIIGLLQVAFLFAVGILAFDMRIGGSPVGVVLVTMATVYCAVTLGLFVASFGGSGKQVGGIVSVLMLVLGMLGGAMIPREIMPDAMRLAGLATPHAWAVDAYHDLVLRTSTGVVDVLIPIAVLTAFGTMFAIVGASRFKFNS